jgi:hypothetical protein
VMRKRLNLASRASFNTVGGLSHDTNRTLRRYSSEGQREASIDDQFRNCERYVEHKGLTITA